MDYVGTVGLLTTEQGRFSRFWTCFLNLRYPGKVKIITKMSLNIAEARNEVLRDAEGEWVWFMDDDHTFEGDLLQQLLARNVDVIQPLVLTRYGPFGPVMMGPRTDDGKAHWRYALVETLPAEIVKVNVVGCAGMLIRRHVWEGIPQPPFEAGQFNNQTLSEDVTFCHKVTEAGFEVWTDLQHVMGHLNVGEVYPKREKDGKWRTVVKFGETIIEIPPAAPTKKIPKKAG